MFDRTFGIEFEFANVEKKKVQLPSGFSWSKDEVVINTDGSNGTYTGSFGGEVNTPPLKLRNSDRETLKEVFDSLIDAGGKITWTKSIHVHIYTGDFSIDQLKNVFYLMYHTSQFIKDYGDVGEWNEQKWQSPSPNMEYFSGVKYADTLERFFNVFANSMNKGYIRHLINVPSHFKRKTIEFRFFNPSYNFEDVEASVLFAYRFIHYAVTHTEEDFKRITCTNDFAKALKLKRPLAKKTQPLLFAGDQTHPHECFVSKSVSLSNKFVKVLTEQADKELALVCPNLYYLELTLYKKCDLSIYNNDELNHIIYMMATSGFKIEYHDKFSFIQDVNDDTAERQIVCLLLFHRLKKYVAENEYAIRELGAYKERLQDSIDKMTPTATEIIVMLNSCKYYLGSVEDAIQNEKNVFYQYDSAPKMRSTVSSLRKHSTYCFDFEKKNVDFYNLVERVPEGTKFMTVSQNEFLQMNRIGKIGKQIFYTTQAPTDTKIVSKRVKPIHSLIYIPYDELQIDDQSKLKIVSVTPTVFRQVQVEFVRKVEKISTPRFCFFVMYDKYCIGGFGFEYPKETEYDLWLLSDFSTNNAIPRISKLILLCVKTDFVKKALQRSMKILVSTIYTKVYTTNHVSMKYRGQFKKVKSEENSKSLKYETMLGEQKYNEVVDEYQKIINRKQ